MIKLRIKSLRSKKKISLKCYADEFYKTSERLLCSSYINSFKE